MTPIWRPSPNFGARRDGLKPELVVLHYTAMDSAEAALNRLCDPASEVSAHYLIGGDGALWQMVREEDRAWHAGAGSWRGRGDVNSRSIGIELDNRGDHPFSGPQMAALEELLGAIMERWSILPSGIIGHSDMAPGRKIDPGPRFDWRRLANLDLAYWPDFDPMPDSEVEGGNPEMLEAALKQIGYPEGLPKGVLLAAFRSRFRPFASGPMRHADQEVAVQIAGDGWLDRNRPSA